MVSLALEIDEDDGYEDGKKDYFFTYAIESKDYYCMPVAGQKCTFISRQEKNGMP